MSQCHNCGCALDPKRTKAYHRETYYCGTDETGRISVACDVIAVLKESIALMEAEKSANYMTSWPDDEGL